MGDFAYRLVEVEKRVDKHHKDLYEGNGRPALTERMALMEDCYEKLARNLNKGVWLLVGTLLTALASLLVIVLKGTH